MDAANRRADAGVLFDQIDAAIKIVAAENDVIEQSGYLIFFIRVCRPRCGRRGKRAAGQGEKKTAGNHPWHLVILDAELSRNMPLLGLARNLHWQQPEDQTQGSKYGDKISRYDTTRRGGHDLVKEAISRTAGH